jgi:hypothetical protein
MQLRYFQVMAEAVSTWVQEKGRDTGAIQDVLQVVRMNAELTRQLGDRPVPSDRRQRHLRLERRVVLLPCPLHVLLLRYRAF